MVALGALVALLLFVVVPAVGLAAAIALSVYEVYRIGERKLLIVVAILALMLQHQLLEAYAFLQSSGAVAEGIGEVFETGANLIAAGSVYYVLRFTRRERRLVRDLRRSERQYRDLIEESPTPILLHGRDGIQYANDAAVEMLDAADRGAITGTDLSEFLTEEVQRVREATLTDGGTDVVESRLRTRDGRTRHAVLTGAPADYEGEDVRQVVIRDVTERKRREREYEQIFNGVNDGITISDPETGELIQVNDSFCELLGYDREEILERGVEGISDVDRGFTMERAREIIREIVESGEPRQFEWAVETSDGETRWLDVKGAPGEIGGQDRYLSIARDVTERKRREREYEQIFNGVNDSIVIHDPETGEMVDVNDSFCDLLGYDREEVLERGTAGISVAEEGFTRDRADEIISQVMAGETKTLEWKVRTSDGEQRLLEVTATAVQIGGDPRHVSLMRDVTERRRREREYEQIFDSVTNAITVFHPETAEILNVNETYHELLGYDDLETIRELGIEGLSVTEEGYTGARGRELVREVAETDETTTVEWRGETSDGERLWLEATLTPAEIGGEQRVLSIQRDVTERKRREREYEQIFDSVNDGIIVWDPETLDIIDANEAYFEMLGYDDIAELRELGVDGLSVTEEGYTETRGKEIHQRVAETGEPELVEWRGETSDGERLWLEVKVARAVIGGEERTISINRDVTERKRREQRLEVFNRILRHNLRNHLDVIGSHAEVLADRTDGDHADRILTSTERLGEMGKRARTIDRFMARELRETTVDLPALVGETLDALDATDSGVTVTVDAPSTAPMVTDGEVLGVVLESVLDNAVRYADSTVTVTVETASEGYVVTVADDGPGIPSEELVPLDAETETEFQHARGLGLWQLKWGVEKLNGTLSFDTGDGTTVRITVPDLAATED
jgi:PAS domain S-box-containing protein